MSIPEPLLPVSAKAARSAGGSFFTGRSSSGKNACVITSLSCCFSSPEKSRHIQKLFANAQDGYIVYSLCRMELQMISRLIFENRFSRDRLEIC
jgi:hypothetical protein